ncbi:hypothetical protein QFC22_006277 [Naganishia vaughanmartiniae]|uniref:Uncharacterized protein n=1 Tax=Naganishia vaughanmartiniae TaxID=1424756 RepID=A0ACC2WMG2_9TREE|nr:hypothetical protein QFC22_006277 [Naganishia vaughanmartiniae]
MSGPPGNRLYGFFGNNADLAGADWTQGQGQGQPYGMQGQGQPQGMGMGQGQGIYGQQQPYQQQRSTQPFIQPVHHSYGQQVPPGFQQPFVPPQQQQQPLTQQPETQTRTHQFREWYTHHLSTLTFNSRPIIDRLSMAAWDRSREGDWDGMRVVGDCLRGALDAAPATQKLPLFYLLDSISKNAGPPYTTHIFPPFLAQVYLRAYSQVDGITKKKMEDMLTTWRTTKGTGTPEGELFPREVRSQIEQAIYGRIIPAPMPAGNGMQMPMQQSIYPPPSIHNVPGSPFMPTPPQVSLAVPHSAAISRDSVTTTLLTTLSLKRAQLAKNPHDTSTQNTVGILEQLQAHLNAGSVSQAELVAIQQQLDQFRSTPTTPSYPTNVPPIHQQPAPPLNMPQPVQYPGGFGQTTQSPQIDFSNPGGLNVPAAGGPAAGLDFSSLLGNLARAGILSQTGTPDGGSTTPRLGAHVTSLRQDREASVGSVNSRADGHEGDMVTEDEPDGMEEYEEIILSMNVQLTITDLSQPRDFQPTSHLPNRCSQCAARFAAGKTGKDRLQAHLDWHFRRNRKERESEGRGANRRWLPRAEVWVNDIAAAFTGVRDEGATDPSTGVTLGMAPRPGGSDRAGAAAAAQQRRNMEVELRKKWVTMPPNPAGKRQCPICKEEFVDEFVQDEEEWVWRNCVMVKNSYYHATCRADALATAAANRKATAIASDGHTLRAPSPSGTASRENTPPPPPSFVNNVKAEISASPLKQSVRMEVREETDADGAAGDAAGQEGGAKGQPTPVEEDVKMHVPHEQLGQVEINEPTGGVKRKAEGSPDHSDKEVKKEKSE